MMQRTCIVFGLKHREIIYDGIKVLNSYDPVPPLLESPYPDGREKYYRLYWFFDIFEMYEMEITIPPPVNHRVVGYLTQPVLWSDWSEIVIR